APDECRATLDAIIASYQDFLKDKYRNVTSEMLELVTRARELLQKDLEAKQTAYNEFRQRTPPVWKGRDGGTVVQDRLFSIEQKRTALRVRQAELQATLAAVESAIKEGRSPGAVLELLSRPLANREVVAPSLLAPAEAWKPGNTRITLEAELV